MSADPTAIRASRACVSSDLILDFVNTRPGADGDPDLLADGEGFSAWISSAGSADPDQVAGDADAAVARELRGAFVGLLRAHSGCDDERAEAEAYLARIAERYPLTPRLDATGLTLSSGQSGMNVFSGGALPLSAKVAAMVAQIRAAR